MNALAKILAPLALVATILPALLFLFNAISGSSMKITMLIATIVWFAAAPYWMKGGSE